MVWVLVGVRGCVLRPTGHSLVTLFPIWSVKYQPLHCTLGKSQIYLSRAHTWVWALGRLVALLSRIRLFPDRLSGFCFGGGGSCTALSPGLRGGAWSPSLDGDLDTRDKIVMGWSCLCLGYKWGVCFWGTQLHRVGTTCLDSKHRSKN